MATINDWRKTWREVLDRTSNLEGKVKYLLEQGKYQEALEVIEGERPQIMDALRWLEETCGLPRWYEIDIRDRITNLEEKIKRVIRDEEEKRLREEANREFERDLQNARTVDELLEVLMQAPERKYISLEACLYPAELIGDVIVGNNSATFKILSQLENTNNDVPRIIIPGKVISNLNKYKLTPEEKIELIIQTIIVISDSYRVESGGDKYFPSTFYVGKLSGIDFDTHLREISRGIEAQYSPADMKAYIKKRRDKKEWKALYRIATKLEPLPYMTGEMREEIEKVRKESAISVIDILAENEDLETLRKIEKESYKLPRGARTYLYEKLRELEIEAYRKTLH
jgi:hypothetical protein